MTNWKQIVLSGYSTPVPYFWRLCAFSQKIKQLWTKYPMDLFRNVPMNSNINFYFSRDHCCEVTVQNVRRSIFAMFWAINQQPLTCKKHILLVTNVLVICEKMHKQQQNWSGVQYPLKYLQSPFIWLCLRGLNVLRGWERKGAVYVFHIQYLHCIFRYQIVIFRYPCLLKHIRLSLNPPQQSIPSNDGGGGRILHFFPKGQQTLATPLCIKMHVQMTNCITQLNWNQTIWIQEFFLSIHIHLIEKIL